MNPLGAARSLEPFGSLPQAALRLDPHPPLYADETWIEVEKLHIDSASFRQLQENGGASDAAMAQQIESIVAARGKMQNPVTGSGGMLLGAVREIGPEAPRRFQAGDRIATLVSLTLTPLQVSKIKNIDRQRGQIEVEGRAILFSSAPAVKMPEDFSEAAALAIFDVCGAPAWVRRLAADRRRILILGAGKSGVLSAAAAAEANPEAEIRISDRSASALERAMTLGFAKGAVQADAQIPEKFLQELEKSDPSTFDLVVNTCNAPETESAAILAAAPGGRILFFNMATQFSRAVLSAEGLGRDVELWMGNGYAEGHAEAALDLVRRHASLRRFFERK
ncbi:MAG TPA: L-erythro-3,5-diaminohexanoate dehydrogenase [Deltaproteobacteria bacterium]|nr:L-erythro-3,5-diaminohexanoate dehydrogenase [Deltaproteobacteria bacterium]